MVDGHGSALEGRDTHARGDARPRTYGEQRARISPVNGASTPARAEAQPTETNAPTTPEAQSVEPDMGGCPQRDWRKAPEVTWRSDEDKAMASDPDGLEAKVESIRDRVWAAVPGRQKAVLSVALRYINLAWVPGREDPFCPVRDSLAWRVGTCREGPGISLNLALLRHSLYPDDELVFTLAHELAHGIIISERRCVAQYARQRAEEDSRIWSALREQYEDVAGLYEGPLAQCMDLDDPYDERFADALVLTWGFGTELAKARDIDCIDDPMPDPEGEKGLMLELADVYRTLKWRMDRDSWEEELPVAAEHVAVSMDTFAPEVWRGYWRFSLPLNDLQAHRREATRLVCRTPEREEDGADAVASEGAVDDFGADYDRVLVVPNAFILANLPNLSVQERFGNIYVHLKLACGGGNRLGDCSTAAGVEFEQWLV